MLKGAIIGKNINYSKSPKFYNDYFNKNKITGVYDIINLENKIDLENIFKNREYSFFNITQPYKNDAIKYVDVLDSISKKTQNINLIIRKDNKLFSFNSDYYGFSAYDNILNKDNINNILIVGRGGVAKTIYTYLKNNYENKKISILSPRENKIPDFFKNYEEFHPNKATAPILCYRFDLMIFVASHLAEKLVVDFNLSPLNIINVNYQSDELKNYALLNKIPYIDGLLMLEKQFNKNIELLEQVLNI